VSSLPGNPWPGWRATYEAGLGTPAWRRSYEEGSAKWRRAYEKGVERARVERERVATLRRSTLAETERKRLVREMSELSVWWDGPGSEGRCV